MSANLFVLLALSLTTSIGCGVHRYDPATGIDELWGIGRLRMRVTPAAEGVRGVVTEVDLVGIGTGLGRERYHLSVGLDRQRRLTILGDDVAVRLEWPSGDFLAVRLGSEPPFGASPSEALGGACEEKR